MKYLIKIFIIFLLSISFIPLQKVMAATENIDLDSSTKRIIFYILPTDNSYKTLVMISFYTNGSQYANINYMNNYFQCSNYQDISIDYYRYYSSNPESPVYHGSITLYNSTHYGSQYYFSAYSDNDNLYVVKGREYINYSGTIIDENTNNDPWYIDAWGVFQDYMSGKPFHWIKTLGDFWKDRYTDLRGFWNNLFHKDSNGDIQKDMTLISPTPLPPSPTPIPYSTIVVFDSNTNSYIYKYEYTDNNNNTIIATSPPEQPNSGPGNGENIKDDYYPSNPLDVPRDNGMWSPQFTINLGDGETLDIDLNTMNDTLIQGAEPYLDDIDASTDLFGAIPQDWFFLIGFCAIIPLICGIINRFLG